MSLDRAGRDPKAPAPDRPWVSDFTCFATWTGYVRVALVIDAERRRFTCSIYDDRPDACRALQRGSGHCRADIGTKRPLALAQLRTPGKPTRTSR